jgi:hypothetical protein
VARIWTAAVSSCLFFASFSFSLAAGKPSETLFPDTTRGYLSIPNTKNLTESWNKTQLGQLIKDPVMKPFVDDVRRQIDERWTGVEKLGITLDDIRGVPNGELALAVVQPGPEKEAMVVLLDVTGHQKEAEQLLGKVERSVTKEGGKRSETSAGGTKISVFTFPKPNDADTDAPPPAAYYFHKDGLLAASDHLDTLKGILERAGGKKGKSLSDVATFQTVMARVKKDSGNSQPQLKWYIQPLGYIEVIRAANAERLHRKGRSMLDIFKAQGFTALQGVGGEVDFAVGSYEMTHRTAILAPGPYQRAMKMLSFPNNADLAPLPWVPADVAGHLVAHCDVANAFDNFGPLFDEMFNEGKPGLWDDVLTGLRSDPNGPRIDLRKELIAHLGTRITVLANYQLPIGPTSERILVGIALKDEKAAKTGIKRLFQNDAEMKRREFKGHEIWERIPEKKTDVPEIGLELPGEGSAPPPKSSATGQQSLLPNEALVVAKGHLMIASHLDFLQGILDESKKPQPLTKSIEYQVVVAQMAKFGAKQRAFENFAKTDEQYRPTYELIRQAKMPESETMFGRVLNAVLGSGKKGVKRKQQIDGSKLPEFDFVRRYLGPAGLQLIAEKDGWLVKGFLLKKGQ